MAGWRAVQGQWQLVDTLCHVWWHRPQLPIARFSLGSYFPLPPTPSFLMFNG